MLKCLTAHMTGKIASRLTPCHGLIVQLTIGIGEYRCDIKFNKRRIESAPMGIMALGTGDPIKNNMELMGSETFISKNTCALMTGIAEFIGLRALGPAVSYILMSQYGGIDRPMWAFGTGRIIITMTIGAVYQARCCSPPDTRYGDAPSIGLDRMK